MGERKFDIDREAQSLTNNFGIDDTQTIEATELNTFLTDGASTATADHKTITPKDKEEVVEETPVETKAKPKPPVSTEKEKASLQSFLENDEPVEEEVETKQEEKPTEKEDNSNVFSRLAKDLYELSIFSQVEGEPEISTAEDFLKKFNTEKEQQAYGYLDSFLSQFGDDYKEAFEAIYVNGVSPKDYFTTSANIQSFKDLDLTLKHNQERIFKEYWKQQGLSEEKIVKRLEKAIDFESLQDEATEFHEVLLQKEEQNKARLIEERKYKDSQKKAEEQAFAQSLNETLSKKLAEKEIDGIPLSQKEAEEIFDYMYTKKWKLPNGELLTDQEKEYLELKDPRNIELRIKHALLQKRKFDLSKVVKTGISKKADALFSNLARDEKQAKAQFKSTTGSKSFF